MSSKPHHFILLLALCMMLIACGTESEQHIMTVGEFWDGTDVMLIQENESGCTLLVGSSIKDELLLDIGRSYQQGETVFLCKGGVTVSQSVDMPIQDSGEVPFTLRSKEQWKLPLKLSQYLILQDAQDQTCAVEYRNDNPRMGSEFIEIKPGGTTLFQGYSLTCVDSGGSMSLTVVHAP